MSIKFEFLPHSGESILITTDEFTMLIDAGGKHPFKNLEFKKLKREIPKIDIAILTHIDSDHIRGFNSLLNDKYFTSYLKYLVFNEPQEARIFSRTSDSELRSAAQATLISHHIRTMTHIKHINDLHTLSDTKEIFKDFQKLKLKILSPTDQVLCELKKEWKFDDEEKLRSAIIPDIKSSIENLAKNPFIPDPSLSNKSSIAFILEYENKSYLFLGDAHIDQINKELKKLKDNNSHDLNFEFIKLSHHGSKHNINPEFIELVQTNKYIICRNTSSSTIFTLPDRETIAKIVYFSRIKNNQQKINFYVSKKINIHLNFGEETEKFNFEIKPLKNICED